MALSKFKWVKFAEHVSEVCFSPGEVAEISADGKKYCIARRDDQWFGFASSCPHAGAPLSDGYLDRACNLVCPVHNLKFNLKTGRDVNSEGYKLKTYPVEVRPEGLFIGVEEGVFLKKWF